MTMRCLIVFAILASSCPARADESLRQQMRDASACSDATLQDFAAHTCESPEVIAEKALAKCRDKWNAVAANAMGTSGAKSLSKEQSRTLKVYSDAMEYEYVRAAELKAIEMRSTAGRCGFE